MVSTCKSGPIPVHPAGFDMKPKHPNLLPATPSTFIIPPTKGLLWLTVVIQDSHGDYPISMGLCVPRKPRYHLWLWGTPPKQWIGFFNKKSFLIMVLLCYKGSPVLDGDPLCTQPVRRRTGSVRFRLTWAMEIADDSHWAISIGEVSRLPD